MKELICRICKRSKTVLNLFEGEWICTDCYKPLKANKDRNYFEKLLKPDKENLND